MTMPMSMPSARPGGANAQPAPRRTVTNARLIGNQGEIAGGGNPFSSVFCSLTLNSRNPRPEMPQLKQRIFENEDSQRHHLPLYFLRPHHAR
jgi:hypothetical protein